MTSMTDRLVLWTMETGLIASLVAVLVMSFFLAMKNNYIWIGLYAILASVNANSLLASLNGRLMFRKMQNESLHMATMSSPCDGRSKSQEPLVIDISHRQQLEVRPEVFKYEEK
ncbi:hypothetical protein EV702DRAFT_1059582 [Suillus placidus]|uniref:DUF6534 domain-containing protein n=1 Tax=Suillus placidus TaxID=48579 RepID=A0A9P7D855_9AGAM|nr:hypothetical protein EV702DRAFT_1059582 [Suillus placidus]